jgi:glycine/D-amino acid oxidase-like deaminating enzyme
LTIAATLPKDYEVTIIARNLPGDPESTEWASPWAGAIWMGSEDASPSAQKMQLDSLAYWMRLAGQYPESSVKMAEMHDLMDHVPLEKVWYRNMVPGFRVMDKSEIPADAKLGVAYQSIIVTPHTFLPWIRKRLESSGVIFKKSTVRSLADLKGMGHDFLINASGGGPKTLTDIKDDSMISVRGQTCLVKSDYDKVYIRRGDDYTYHLPRGDGTAILGGIKDEGQSEAIFEESVKRDVSHAF